MGSGLTGSKKKDAYKMPPHNASNEQMKWQKYCIDNNIRISPYGINNEPGKWKIAIALGPYKRGEKIYYAPNVYDKYSIWPEYYKMCKYYYDKHTRRV
tara:strand:+ start:1005 stop:1298 length:294 start_codon:yes stop_codon:yes gene_type:complete